MPESRDGFWPSSPLILKCFTELGFKTVQLTFSQGHPKRGLEREGKSLGIFVCPHHIFYVAYSLFNLKAVRSISNMLYLLSGSSINWPHPYPGRDSNRVYTAVCTNLSTECCCSLLNHVCEHYLLDFIPVYYIYYIYTW